ncbi:MAG: peroxiredoxin [Planctomycetota bacterium]
MLKVGDRAPEFELKDDSGETVRLSELLEAGPLVLYFYPADFTPGCTKEACSFRDRHEDVTASGLRIFGVSPQSSERHAEFRERYRLPFRLLADPDRRAIAAFDAKGPLGLGVRRITYLIGDDGLIRGAVQADLRIGRHEQFLDEAIREMSAGT